MKGILRVLLYLGVSCTATGCEDPKVFAEKSAEMCVASGYQKGTPPFEQCMIAAQQAEAERKEQIGAAIAAGFSSYGAAQQSYARTMPQTTRCNSYELGYSVHTDCSSY